MPFIGRTPNECFGAFEVHVRDLVAQTLTTRFPVFALRSAAARSVLCFWQGRPTAIPLDTRHGRVFFFVQYLLEAEPDGGRYRLTIRAYVYRLQQEPSGRESALVRWEYAPESAGTHPRFHVQPDAVLPSRALGDLDLDKLHLPTGLVPLEEVIRFLIADLGVTPPCGPDQWDTLVGASERQFFEQFAG